MRRPRLLDLFCGAGGASAGYHRAGFDVTGVDIQPQPRYPFSFVQADALSCGLELRAFDVIHASPPCQAYSHACFSHNARKKHEDLLAPVREMLRKCNRPYVIENVLGAPLSGYCLMLCGLMFDLKVFRHRWFESSELLMSPGHRSHRGKLIGRDGMCCVVGNGGGMSVRMRKRFRQEAQGFKDTNQDRQKAMDIDWMNRYELSQAIPPAYALFIGRQLMTGLMEGRIPGA